MSRGYVYILVNEAMPGLVKIGKTARCVDQRARELSQTGVPFPFEVFASVFCPDCNEVEALAHKELAACRVNQAREFFLCDLDKALLAVENAHREQVEAWLDEFLPGHGIHEPSMFLDPVIPVVMSTHVGIPAEDVVDAYAFMTPDDIRPAIRRMADHRSGARQMQWLRPAEGDAP